MRIPADADRSVSDLRKEYGISVGPLDARSISLLRSPPSPAPQQSTAVSTVDGWPADHPRPPVLDMGRKHGDTPVARGDRRHPTAHDDDGTACCFLVRNDGGES